MNTTDLANVPMPAGAVEVDAWYDTNFADVARYFSGTSRVVECDGRDGDFTVQIDGTQYATGRAKRFIWVAEGNTERLIELTSARARELGRALIAAADDMDEMTEYDQMKV